MGLAVRIRLYSATEDHARAAATAAFSRMAELDRMMIAADSATADALARA